MSKGENDSAYLFFSYGELLHSLSDVPEFREFDPSSAAVQVHLKSQIKLKLFHFHLVFTQFTQNTFNTIF
jgi:hypothetical protein